ncbi:MAG: pyruvate ferredoxin oxidoreductase [Dehalococcoidia bacterium]|nr:pyruvate ferredoxin oxidoreductase [Dehalococcoidia bacterium]
MIMIDTGDRIAAKAAQMARPEFIAAYPITPQTVIVEKTAEMVESGELDAEYVRVESEHSAMSAVVGAASTGIRTFTATSSHGLALMHEMLHWAAMARLPVVMVNVNRALGPGWNIWADQSDALSQRDTGWIQLYCSSGQEIFDTIIQAYRLAELDDVQLPVMVNFDAFVMSHTSMPVEVPEQPAVDAFLPRWKPQFKLDPDDPITLSNMLPQPEYGGMRKNLHEGLLNAKRHWTEVCSEWTHRFSTDHGAAVQQLQCDDAEVILVSMGAFGAEARMAVQELRAQGKKVGLARIRMFRPFPDEVFRALAPGRKFVVVERNVAPGVGGTIAAELRSGLYGYADAPVKGFIAGLGGRDVTFGDICQMVDVATSGKAGDVEWWGIKD